MKTFPEINAYILAGGKSLRMGNDKGLLLLNKKPIVSYVMDVLNTKFDSVCIVSNNIEYKKFGLKLIPDMVADCGPGGGIYTALTDSKAQWNFIVSCDMPFISVAGIEFLINHRGEEQITIPSIRNKIEPLFGLYAKNCAPLWQKLLAKNIYKLQHLIDHFTNQQLRVDGIQEFERDFFMNINTPTDYEKAKSRGL